MSDRRPITKNDDLAMFNVAYEKAAERELDGVRSMIRGVDQRIDSLAACYLCQSVSDCRVRLVDVGKDYDSGHPVCDACAAKMRDTPGVGVMMYDPPKPWWRFW
jgi:hypothetical protein